MANEKYIQEVETRFTTSGEGVTLKALQQQQDRMDALHRAGEMSTQALNKLSGANRKMEESAKSGTDRVRKYSESFAQLRKEASYAEQALQKSAQAYVVGGGRDVRGFSSSQIGLEDARRNIAVAEASSQTLLQASQERVRLEGRLNAAQAEGARLSREVAGLGQSRLAQAKESLRLAEAEAAAAQKNRSAVAAGRGTGSSTIQDQVAAEERLVASQRRLISSQRELTRAQGEGTVSSVSQRYANYDLAASYGVISASLIGVGALTASTFADMESGFTKVERTSGLYGDALEPVTKQLLELSRVLPVTTDEIQDLAARGAQMGIATSEIGNFAEVMAKFVATSPEVDVNSVAEAFGRLSNLTGTDDFEALASSIAQVGVLCGY